jgi:hypothetical protein
MDLTSTICCQAPKNYSEEYDAYYCGPCNVWSEDKCGDVECEFCKIRPELPNCVNET